MEQNVEINHNNIWPVIPEDIKAVTRNDFRSYMYLVLRQSDNSDVYIGLPWIVPSSFKVSTQASANVRLTARTEDELNQALSILRANNIQVART